MSALDKVLRLAADAEPPAYEDEGAAFIRAAAEDLNELALLLASSDDDGEGDDYDEDDDDQDEDDESPKGKKKPFGGKGKKPFPPKKKVKASALVLDAMVALSHLQGGEEVSLSVLDTADRKKKSAHTIAGSTDYPIPDEGHLKAAIARYKQGALAGHSAKEVASHIRSRARALGVQVDLSVLDEAENLELAYKFLPLKQYEAAHPFKNNFGSSAPKAPAAPAAPKTPGPPKPPGSSSARSSSGAGGARTSTAKAAPSSGARTRYSAVQKKNLNMHQWHQAHLEHLEHLHAMHLEHMEHMHGQA